MSRRSKGLIVGLAILAVGLMAATVVTFVATRRSNVSYPSQWDPRVLPIVHFDEQERGLTFKHPVQIIYMAPKAFDKTVTTSSGSLSAKDKAQISAQEASLRAIGLIDGKVDLFKQENDLSSGGVLAYYDPKDQKVRVKGTALTPDVRVTLAHELTHALQDQYFGLKREDTLKDDPQQAFRSVVEGDAVVVQNAYADTMSQKDQAAYNKAEDQGSDQAYSGIPDALVAQQVEPYIIGPAFVELLKQRGGNEAIDQAIKNPPASTAALMNVFNYLAQPSTGTTPTTMTPFKLAAGQKRVDDGDNTFGALTWYLMLARRLDVHDAIKAVDNWSSDTSLGYQTKSGQVCLEADYKASSAGGATTMEGLLEKWKAAQAGTNATITDRGNDVVELNVCDPGTSVRLTGTDRSTDALTVIAARIQIAEQFAKANFPDSVAQCASNGTIARLSIDDIVGNGDSDKDQAAVQSAVAACH
jgi:hypothetical protein